MDRPPAVNSSRPTDSMIEQARPVQIRLQKNWNTRERKRSGRGEKMPLKKRYLPLGEGAVVLRPPAVFPLQPATICHWHRFLPYSAHLRGLPIFPFTQPPSYSHLVRAGNSTVSGPFYIDAALTEPRIPSSATTPQLAAVTMHCS